MSRCLIILLFEMFLTLSRKLWHMANKLHESFVVFMVESTGIVNWLTVSYQWIDGHKTVIHYREQVTHRKHRLSDEIIGLVVSSRCI